MDGGFWKYSIASRVLLKIFQAIQEKVSIQQARSFDMIELSLDNKYSHNKGRIMESKAITKIIKEKGLSIHIEPKTTQQELSN